MPGTVFPTTGTQAIRWLPVINVGTAAIPQMGVMRIVGTRLVARQVVFEVRTPTARSEQEQDVSRHLVNGPTPIIPNGGGRASRDWPLQIAVENDQSQSVGSLWRMTEGSCKLTRWTGGDLLSQEPSFQQVSYDLTSAGLQSSATIWAVPSADPLVHEDIEYDSATDGGHLDTTPIWNNVVVTGDAVLPSYCALVLTGANANGIRVFQSGFYFVWFNGCLQFEWDGAPGGGGGGEDVIESGEEGEGGGSVVPVPSYAGRTIAFWKCRYRETDEDDGYKFSEPGSSEITGVRTFYTQPLVTIDATPSVTAETTEGGRSISLYGIVECDADDILDVRISVPESDYFSAWRGARFGCLKIGDILS